MPTIPSREPSALPEIQQTAPNNINVTPQRLSGGAGQVARNTSEVLHQRARELHVTEQETIAKDLDVTFADNLREILDDPDNGYLNKQGREAYDTHNDIRKQVSKLRQKHQSTLKPGSISADLFRKVADSRVEHAFNSIAKHASNQLRIWQDDTYKARLLASIDDATVNRDDPAQVRLAINTGFAEIQEAGGRNGWAPEVMELRKQSFATDLHTQIIQRIVSEDLEAAQAYYQDNQKEIDPTVRTQLEENFQAIEDREVEKIASDLELNVYKGNASRADIDDAFDTEIISGPKRTQLLKEIDRQDNESVAARDRQNLISTGLPLDPKDKKHRQAVDEAFVRLGATEPVAIALTKQTGILPGPVRSVFRTAARSGEGRALKEALELYSAIDDQVPLALDDLPLSDIAVLDNATQLIRGGLPSAKAMEIARQQANIPEAERKVLLERFKEQAKDKSDWLQDALDSDDAYDTELFAGAPTPPAAMQADYERLTEAFYIQMGGDIEQARETAWKNLKRAWTRSDINGEGELMRYSPEYDLSVSTKVLRSDLNKQLEEIKVKPDNIRVISDVLTARSKRGQRSYALVKTRPDGLLEILRGPNNMPLRWVPDPHSILNKQHQDAVSRAKRARNQHEQAQRVRKHFPDGG
ncbi:MAG: hypothetical protein B6D76_09395 [gamma proteobacterium symbiont of Stewartia floridana]|nr:MAG: hypothetical protein B6D76_09395 [gamma proteobacterium symbiont of Stewartia floridana]RLW59579.1 MAG: hypothetical protein B6D75_08785 [gamma proteobacterium symbiont of Stewartia floridana]